MNDPDNVSTSSDVNVANDVSTWFAPLMPVSAADVRAFVFQAAYALGENESALARCMGVSKATLSSWKARGAIPDVHRNWFLTTFVFEVLHSSQPRQHDGVRHVGIEYALALYQRTDFDPFAQNLASIEERVALCFQALSGVSRLALFVLRRSEETSRLDLAERRHFVLDTLAGLTATASRVSH